MDYLFSPPPVLALPIKDSNQFYPLRRIFCVGRNYAAHALEMNAEVDKKAPFYFSKSRDAYVASGSTIPMPLGSNNFHHEVELVIAIGKAGVNILEEDANKHIFGYACGLDLTRRDLQKQAQEKSLPWDFAKDFEQSAVVGEIMPIHYIADIENSKIWLKVNGEIRQNSLIKDMIWKIPELIAYLSKYYHLMPGDLIYTGTPEGVGPLQAGDKIKAGIDQLSDLKLEIKDSSL